jgi:hypothetical protein
MAISYIDQWGFVIYVMGFDVLCLKKMACVAFEVME